MSEEFQLRPLGDLVKILDAKRKPITKSDRKAGIYPYYGASGIADYIDNYIFDGTYLLLSEDGDNLKTRNTPIAFIVKGQFWVNNHAHILEANSKNLTEYLCYALQVADVDSFISGSTRPKLTQGDIKKILISVPPFPEQKAIAHILGKLDDKIELNRQMNQTLEAIAQALFKSWFVDFDPVLDNALAQGSEIPEALQAMAEKRRSVIASEAKQSHRLIHTNPELAAQFPETFVFNETLDKWIPEGWVVKSLAQLLNLIGGGTPKTSIDEYWNGDIPWFSVVDAPSDTDVFVIKTEKNITKKGVDNSSTKILGEWTTIISARGTVGKCAIVGVPMAMNQSCYGVKNKAVNQDIFTYLLLRKNVSDLQNKSHGSVFSTITRDTFAAILIVTPKCNSLQESFEKQVSPLFEKIKSNLFETESLSRLRDTLLPELISGRVRVSEQCH